jgi:hypothetical protein
MRTSRLVCCFVATLLILCSVGLSTSQAGQAGLAWDAPTTNTDGTSLTDLAGYYVYYWQDAWEVPQSVDVGNQMTYTATNLTDGATYSFAVTAYNTAGTESAFSNQLSVTLPPLDSDGDGLTDTDEQTVYGTDPSLADTDGDGIDDGAEVTYWGADWAADIDGDGQSNVLDPDADNDGFTDGEEQQAGTDPGDATAYPQPAPQPSLSLPLEVGELVADQTWQHITLQRTFVDPVVVVASMEVYGDDAAVARIRQVGPDGFELRLQEWSDTDGFTPLATVGYMVLERGVHVLDDGTRIEAGRFDTNATRTWVTVPLTASFTKTPVVLAASVTTNETDPVIARLDQVSATTFDFQLQEGEGFDGVHAQETIAYVAWAPSVGQLGSAAFEVGTLDGVNHGWHTILFTKPFTTTPVFLAGLQTNRDRDPAAVQWRDRDILGVDVQIAEGQSRNKETRHKQELVGFITITPLVP